MAVEVSPEQAEKLPGAEGRMRLSGPLTAALWAGLGAAIAYGILYTGQVAPLQEQLRAETGRARTLEAANRVTAEANSRQAKQLEEIPHMQAEIYTLRHAHELLETENERLRWLVKQDAKLKEQLKAITPPAQSPAPPPGSGPGVTGP